MAKVYLATDLLLHRAVAVKMLHDRFAGDREFVERFRREAQAAASLSHPNVVSIYDVGEDNGTHYIVLEYVKGRNLKDILRRYGPLPIPQAAFVARAVAAALAAAHRQGLVHRDIKPHNILITDEGRVKVTDFGIARAASAATLTQTGAMLGSVHYFSPEQARGLAAGPETDVYSLGVVLYEMLTGKVPFTSETPVAVALKHIQEEPPSPRRYRPRIPEALEAIVMRAMAKDPKERYPSPEHMLADLREFQRQYTPETEELALLQEEEEWWGSGADDFLEEDTARRRASVRWDRPSAEDELDDAMDEAAPDEGDDPTRVMTAIDFAADDDDDEEPEAESRLTRRSARRKRLRRRFVAAAVVLALLYVAIGRGAPAVMNWIFPPDVQVPDVVGRHLDEARDMLREAGLDYALARRVHHPEVPEFHVIAQDPDPQRTVKAGRVVELAMSLGPEIAQVPDVTGLPEREARLILTQQGFTLGHVEEEFRLDVDPNQVVAQFPEPGEPWERGKPVDLWVARAYQQTPRVTLPDFRGLTLDEMRAELARLGLLEGQVWPEPTDRVPPGRIIDQNPPPGQEADVGSTVAFVYSVSLREEAGDGEMPTTGSAEAPEGPGTPPRTEPAQVTVHPALRRYVDASVYVPEGVAQEVVIIVIDDFGAREVFRDTLEGGTRLVRPVEVRGRGARVQVYMGGAMVKDVGFDD